MSIKWHGKIYSSSSHHMLMSAIHTERGQAGHAKAHDQTFPGKINIHDIL